MGSICANLPIRASMIFFQQRTRVMGYAEVIEVDIPSLRFIAYPDIQITVPCHRDSRLAGCAESTGCEITYRDRIGLRVAAYRVELLIKKYPVQVSFWLAGGIRITIGNKIIQRIIQRAGWIGQLAYGSFCYGCHI